MRRDGGATSVAETTTLIQPKMENLTIGPLPTDATNVVIAGPNDLGITDKLNALINEYQSEMVRLPSTGNCASAITAKLPREFIQALYDTLNVNNNGCLQETQTFLQLLVSYLSSTTENYINIPRNFWTQIGRVFNELNVNESKINMYAAAMRAMSMAISCDAQSMPSNNLLVSTLETIDELAAGKIIMLDKEFVTDYPESVMDQPEPNEIMTEVIANVPTTIGESSSSPPTNIIDITASDASDNIQIHDLDDETNLEAQSYAGLKDLFSMKTLGVPLKDLKIIHGGKVITTTMTELKVPISGTVKDTNVEFKYQTVNVLAEQEIILDGVDVNKSLLDQDWALVPANSNRNEDGSINYINTVTLIKKGKKRLVYPDNTVFQGYISKRSYTYPQAMSLASSLSGLWNKIISMKLPSPEHIQTGANILAAGLGAAGQIFGSSGLVFASKVVGSIGDGLGSFIADVKPGNGLTPDPKSSICKNALNVVPGVIEAGKSVYEGVSVNAQHQRIKMSGMKNAIEGGYIMPSTQLQSRSRVRRINNVFV